MMSKKKVLKKETKFEQIYVAHYSRMKRYAKEYTIYEEDAENIVQDVFLELWEHNLDLFTQINIFAYLFTATKNKCIDFLRHKTVVQRTANIIQNNYLQELQLKLNSLEAFDVAVFSEPDIESIIQQAIEKLPEKCQTIFVMNKFEGKKQKAIAEELNISINTVENQMNIAYKKLKEELGGFVSLIFFLFL